MLRCIRRSHDVRAEVIIEPIKSSSAEPSTRRCNFASSKEIGSTTASPATRERPNVIADRPTTVAVRPIPPAHQPLALQHALRFQHSLVQPTYLAPIPPQGQRLPGHPEPHALSERHPAGRGRTRRHPDPNRPDRLFREQWQASRAWKQHRCKNTATCGSKHSATCERVHFW